MGEQVNVLPVLGLRQYLLSAVGPDGQLLVRPVGNVPYSTLYKANCFLALDRSDCNDETEAFWDMPEQETIVMAARMPITTITTRSSTMVKAFEYVVGCSYQRQQKSI